MLQLLLERDCGDQCYNFCYLHVTAFLSLSTASVFSMSIVPSFLCSSNTLVYFRHTLVSSGLQKKQIYHAPGLQCIYFSGLQGLHPQQIEKTTLEIAWTLGLQAFQMMDFKVFMGSFVVYHRRICVKYT